MILSAGEIESTDVVYEDGDRYVVVETETSARPIRFPADRETLKKLVRVAERAMPEENSFRDDPPEDQAGLDEIEMENGSEIVVATPDSEGSWLDDLLAGDDVEIEVPDEDQPEPGDYINPNDPSEW